LIIFVAERKRLKNYFAGSKVKNMKISARDIQVFVAGALALLGARALLYLPYYFDAPVHNAAWIGRMIFSLSAGLDLPLGLAIFFGKRWAILLTQIWLWLSLAYSIFITFLIFFVSGLPKALSYIGTVLPDSFIFIVLLLLIWLSQSKKFRNEPDA
jgi:hypothetical protein